MVDMETVATSAPRPSAQASKPEKTRQVLYTLHVGSDCEYKVVFVDQDMQLSGIMYCIDLWFT
jgi:hypothetical protein